MSGLTVAGLCIAGSICIVRLLHWWIGSGRARLHDLTRPSDYVCQATGEHDNARAFEAYLARLEARNVPRIRPLPEN